MATKGDMDNSSSKASTALSLLAIILCAFVVVRVELLNHSFMRTNSRADGFDHRLQTLEQAIEEIRARKIDAIKSDGKSKQHKEVFSENLKRERRDVQQPNNQTITLRDVRLEINKYVPTVSASTFCHPPGKVCVKGPPGFRGPKGRSGKRGTKGTRGRKGTQGIMGPPGKHGKHGMTGPPGKGQQGVKGDKGDPGPQGIPGIKGEPGESISAPMVMVSPDSKTVFQNQTALFQCSAQGTPPPEVTWHKVNGSVISTGSNGALVISNAQHQDSGHYMCTGRNILGRAHKHVQLVVQVPPKFTKVPSGVTSFRSNQAATIDCSAFGVPIPTIAWTRAGLPLPIGRSNQQNGRLTIRGLQLKDIGTYICTATNKLGVIRTITALSVQVDQSCQEAKNRGARADGSYDVVIPASGIFSVFCHMTSGSNGWTLVARFSNNDTKNWMKDNGEYWYDRQSSVGQTTDPTNNADMISPAFWSVKGTEFKITRSDDSSHTALLQTTSSCLSGHTFRSKLTSYGDFRNGKEWANDKCLGSCDVQYDGQYSSTDGFQQAQCNGDIQSMNKIGFWCDYGSGDGAVVMIGGGGSSCRRADHGIGVTETDKASFIEESGSATEYDFGFDGARYARYISSRSYSLNLWVR